MNPIIEVCDLHKSFGDTHAVEGVSLEVTEGSVLGLLGPNGAGKTTIVRILATLLSPDAGHASVAGFDVVSQANSVRSVIGLTGQYAAVDEKLTGKENLWMVARLLGMTKAGATARADELLERFALTDAADRPLSTYSGGMRRRADLAVSLVGYPRVLFLDEPTTGLDPASRIGLWEITRELVAEGTTVLLTTQYLEEADELADRIVVIDHGSVIAEGTSAQLKADMGGRNLVVEIHDLDELERARDLLSHSEFATSPELDEPTRTIRLDVDGNAGAAARSIALLADASLEIADFHLEQPSLDDVFLSLTNGTDNPDPTLSDPEETGVR
jgi:ABC-2 type transport system ATP-binding protein